MPARTLLFPLARAGGRAAAITPRAGCSPRSRRLLCTSVSRDGQEAASASASASASDARSPSSWPSVHRCDVAIVGGGIVGLATAQELIHRYPELKFALVEKESELSQHQTGHNSGVIHAGIYYQPGSLMAKLCVEGLLSTYKYCDKHGLSYKKCGKLVVATRKDELGRLRGLHERALQNGVPGIQLIEGSKIPEIEPHCQGLEALWSPETGIIDWGATARHYGKVFAEKGGKIQTDFEVTDIRTGTDPQCPIEIVGKRDGQLIKSSYVLTCAGLQSDRVAVMTGCPTDPKIVPFRGEYLLLNPEKAEKIKGNIYPVPDPRFPFLGFHFTPRMNGEVWLGPNAVLAFKREGYSWFDLSLRDLAEVLSYPGFYRLAAKYAAFGSMEMLRSIFIRMSVKKLQEYVPCVEASDLSRGPAGVRAMAMNAQGALLGDFNFDAPLHGSALKGRVLHCRNAPSPAATSSLAIARMMADRLEEEFGLPRRGRAELY